MEDLPGDQVRALPMLIPGRLRADRVRQTSSTSIIVDDWFRLLLSLLLVYHLLIIKLLFYITMINFDPL